MAKRNNTGFSTQSYSPASSRGYPSVPSDRVDTLLNSPVSKMDPEDQQVKTKEKDQMVGLNDKFVAFIDKVRNLEETKQVLETRLRILLEQDSYKGNIDDIVKETKEDLKKLIDALDRDQQKLNNELAKTQNDVERSRQRYEDEIQKKTDLENEFVLNKKDLDDGYLQRVKLELDLEDIVKELDFLRRGFEEEIKELQSLIRNETIVLKAGNSRNLDMDEILQTVKTQYEEMASRSREEAEQWNRRKMDDMVSKAEKHEEDVKTIRREITEIQRSIQRLLSEAEALKRKKAHLEEDIKNSELDGQQTLENTREQIAQLEDALRRDKQLMAQQVREYQELMNLKLALDIEIATYRKLLEGEEMRLAEHQRDQRDVKAPEFQSKEEPSQVDSPDKAKKVLIIRIEVKNGHVVSETSQLL